MFSWHSSICFANNADDGSFRTFEVACRLGLGCWDNNVVNSHLSPFSSRVLRSYLVPQCSHPPHWSCHNDALRTVTGCLRVTTADNVPILAGLQPAELWRRGATLSLARRAMEPGHLLTQLSPVHRVGTHGISNQDAHLYPSNNSSVHLSTTTEMCRSRQISRWNAVLFGNTTRLRNFIPDIGTHTLKMALPRRGWIRT